MHNNRNKLNPLHVGTNSNDFSDKKILFDFDLTAGYKIYDCILLLKEETRTYI